MNNAQLIAHLRKQGACTEAIEWLGARDSIAMWSDCERPDWLLWYAARNGAQHKDIVRVTCQIARTVLHLVPKGEDRPRIDIETTEAWIEEKATLEQVKAVDGAAWAAWAAAGSAARSAAKAAKAAESAESAAESAYWAAQAAAAADGAAEAAQNKISCQIIRTMWPTCPQL